MRSGGRRDGSGLRVLTVIGNRPQFVKAAAVTPLLRAEHEEVLVHTGQHHDDELSRIFFSELGLPAPERQLAIAGGSNTSQTARMLVELEPVLADVRPDVVLVYGDTNSTLAGALSAAQAGVPVAHVEAGMRSGDRTMPEELNRVLTDHASDLLLCPSESAAANLAAESVGGAVQVVGDVMVDVAAAVRPRARALAHTVLAPGREPAAYALVTAHRAGNVDDPDRLAKLVDLLCGLPYPVAFPVHPRTLARLQEAQLVDRLRQDGGVTLLPPLGYVELTALLLAASLVLTDSGGLQKEAYLAKVPCITLRDTTEWTETLATGWNVLCDLDPDRVDAAIAAFQRGQPRSHPQLYGDGHAGERVVAALSERYG